MPIDSASLRRTRWPSVISASYITCLASQGSARRLFSSIRLASSSWSRLPQLTPMRTGLFQRMAASIIWPNWRSLLVALAHVAGVDAVLAERLGAGRDSRSAGGGRCSGSRRSAARRCPCGRAARGCRAPARAASGVLTVMRTISEPASASSLTWIAVPMASTVSVLVIDCTRTGASPPTVTVRGAPDHAGLARAARPRARRVRSGGSGGS